jgi:hypothetical protein
MRKKTGRFEQQAKSNAATLKPDFGKAVRANLTVKRPRLGNTDLPFLAAAG